MALGSPDQATRLEQLRTFAKVQVRSGYRPPSEVRGDVYDAVRDEVKDESKAQRLTDEYLAEARRELDRDAARWPAVTSYDRLQIALAGLERGDVVVLQACDDHWAANERLQELGAAGQPPRGIAYFTHTDVWHAVEHGMLELNVWHGNGANVAEGDGLLDFVRTALARQGIESRFDEGRIEVSVDWQRRPSG